MHEFSICQTLVAAVLKELGKVKGEALAEPCKAKNNIPADGKPQGFAYSVPRRFALGTTKPGLAKKGRQIRLKKARVIAGQYHRFVPASLKQAYKILTRNTPAEGSLLLVKTTPVKLNCNKCGWKGLARDICFSCRKCGGVDLEIIGGKELFLESIEVESAHE